MKLIKKTINEKIWINIGPIKKRDLIKFRPYIKGVVASIETINPKVHDLVCPSKPLAPYERMFVAAKELGLARAMTFIVGMGETREDFQLLKTFIEKYDIDKIHVYGLIPQEGTMFAASLPPTEEEQAWYCHADRRHGHHSL